MRYYLALLVLIPLLFLRNTSIACRCGERSLDSHFKRSDVILKVKIISITDSTLYDTLEHRWYKEASESENRNFSPYRETNFVNTAVIIGSYKGEYKFSDTVSVFSGVGSGDCGFLFEIGKEYIVFAKLKRLYKIELDQVKLFFDKNYLYSDICYGTEEFDLLTDKSLKSLRRDKISD